MKINIPVSKDPLPSWRGGTAKNSIIEFVTRVTKKGSADFVPPMDRVAVFDNDGTLWAEQPLYFQMLFIIDRVRSLAEQHSEWRQKQPFKAVLENDLKTLTSINEQGLMELLMATHAGMTTKEFELIVKNWLATARHPKFKRPYTELVYQPMKELLAFLGANGFKVFIVSGGGIEFIRTFSEKVYGIPPEQVIGSSIAARYEVCDGVPRLVREPRIDFFDDKEGKPIAINKFIGRRPVAAFGNSDGDFEMLEWVTSGENLRFGFLLHHDDAEREFEYDRNSIIGRLSRGLDEAQKHNWIVASIKNDWKQVFQFK